MKLSFTVTLVGLAATLTACGSGSHCNSTLTVGESLDENCYADAGPVQDSGNGQCTPSPNTICTVVGTGEAGKGAEGIPGLRTELYTPQDVGIAADDTPYIIDWNNHRIRKLDAQGNVETVAGVGELSDPDCVDNCDPSQNDQDALQVRLNHPTSITFDPQGRMTIAAWHNSEVKRVDFTTRVMSTIAGTGARSFGGDNGPALMAALNLPVGVAYNPMDGSLWVSDQANQRIRRVDLTTTPPTISTIAGNPMMGPAGWIGGYGGDNGPALMANFNGPTGQAALPASRINFDPQGNLYLADSGNNCVRKLANDAAHTVTTFAGTCGTAGVGGNDGPATAAQLNYPTDVEIAHDGTVYIADTNNHCIRSVDSAGMIHTAAGTCGTRGTTGDGMAPTAALLNHPYGLGIDSQNDLWIADSYNHRIRLVCSANSGSRLCTPPVTTH